MLLNYSWLQLSTAPNDVPHLQKEVPCLLPLQMVPNESKPHMSTLSEHFRTVKRALRPVALTSVIVFFPFFRFNEKQLCDIVHNLVPHTDDIFAPMMNLIDGHQFWCRPLHDQEKNESPSHEMLFLMKLVRV